MDLTTGDKLPNGATLIHYRRWYGDVVILARTHGPQEWVTWRTFATNGVIHWEGTEAGHYFDTLKQAVDDFYVR